MKNKGLVAAGGLFAAGAALYATVALSDRFNGNDELSTDVKVAFCEATNTALFPSHCNGKAPAEPSAGR